MSGHPDPLASVLPGPEQRQPCHVCQGRGDVPKRADLASMWAPRQRCTWCSGTGAEPASPTPEPAQLVGDRAMAATDAWHRSMGHVLCWCSRWYPPADLDQLGTCGGSECRRNAVADLQGLVP